MSTGILFKKQFIKVNNNYVPMVLSGSSNCFDCNSKGGKNRIARGWGNMSFHCGGKLFATENEILSSIDTCLNDEIERGRTSEFSKATAEQVKNAYGWYIGLRIGTLSTVKTTASRYKSFFADGIKKALTIEELRLGGVSIRLTVSKYNEATVLAAGLKMRSDAFMYTTDQFEVSMNEWVSYFGKTAVVNVVYGSEGELERMFESNSKEVVKRVKKAVTSAYLIEFMGNRYFIKRSKKGTYLSYEPLNYQVKKYLTEKAATYKMNTIPNNENYKVVYKTFDAPIYI